MSQTTTTGERVVALWKRFSNWMGSRQCLSGRHTWKPEYGPLPHRCPGCDPFERAIEWVTKHRSEKPEHANYAWLFTPEGVTVACTCGSSIDVTIPWRPPNHGNP